MTIASKTVVERVRVSKASGVGRRPKRYGLDSLQVAQQQVKDDPDIPDLVQICVFKPDEEVPILILASQLDALSLAILTERPSFQAACANGQNDVFPMWLQHGHSKGAISSALEQLWRHQLICTDDDERTSPDPNAKVLFSNAAGDELLERRAVEASSVTDRFVEGMQRLKALRGLRNKDIAARMGVSEAYVSQMMRGQRDIKLSMLDRLQQTFGITVLDIFGPEPDRKARKRKPQQPSHLPRSRKPKPTKNVPPPRTE